MLALSVYVFSYELENTFSPKKNNISRNSSWKFHLQPFQCEIRAPLGRSVVVNTHAYNCCADTEARPSY